MPLLLNVNFPGGGSLIIMFRYMYFGKFTTPSFGQAKEIFHLKWIHMTMGVNMQTHHACGWKGNMEMYTLYCV